MTPASKDRAILVELLVASGLVAMGLFSWQLSPLVVLAPHVADVGKNWFADIVRRGFRRFTSNWLDDRGILNNDILWAAARAFERAIDRLTEGWKKNPHYIHLQRTDPEAADLTLSSLRILTEDARSILGSSVRTRRIVEYREVTGLLQRDEQEIRIFLLNVLSDYLYGHDDEFVNFVQRHLPRELLVGFEEILNSLGDRETRARNAIEWVLLISLLDAQEETRKQLTHLLEGQQWLKDQLSQGYLISAFEYETTIHGALEVTVNSVVARLAEVLIDYSQSDRRVYLNAILSMAGARDAQPYLQLSGSALNPIPPPLSSKILIPPSFERAIQRRASAEMQERTHFASLETALDAHSQIVILGPPGSGKSTLLKSQLLRFCEEALIDPSAPIPVLIHLGDEWQESNVEFRALFESAVRHRGLQMRHPLGLILLLDGVDELEWERRFDRSVDLAKWISDHPGTQVIVTSRTDYHIADFPPGMPTILIEPLDDEKIERFLVEALGEVNGYVVLRKLVPGPGQVLSRDIIHLARTPFFLAIFAYTFDPDEPEKSIPGTLGELFRLLVKALFERETIDREPPYEVTFDSLIGAFGAVSLAMHELGVASRRMDVRWAAKQLPEDLAELHDQLWEIGREMSILELSDENRFIKFKHPLLAEYFAAEHIADSPHRVSAQISQSSFESGRRLPGEWDHVIFMLAGFAPETVMDMIGSKDAFLAVACMDHTPDDFMLAGAGVDQIVSELKEHLLSRDKDARTASLNALLRMRHQDTVVAKMGQLIRKGSPFAKRRAIEVLKSSPEQERAAEYIANVVFDRDGWVRREAADALADLGDVAVKPLQNLYESSKSARRRRKVLEILASIPTVESVRILLAALGDQETEVWREAKRALDLSDMELASATEADVKATRETARMMVAAPDPMRQRTGIQVLSVLGEREDVPSLIHIVRRGNPQLVHIAIEALGTLGDAQVVDELIKLIRESQSPGKGLRAFELAAAVSSLGLTKDATAIPILEWTLGNQNPHVRSAAAQALGRLRSYSSVEALIKRLRGDENPFVRAYCALALGLIGDRRAVPALVSSFDPEIEQYERVRGYAAYGLGLLGDASLTTWLTTALMDPDDKVRQSAAVAMGLLRSPDSCDALTEAIESDPVHYVRQWAALAIGAIGSEGGFAGLELALADMESYVRQKAVGALKGIDHDRSRALLSSLLNDQDRYVRQQAVIGLGVLRASDQAPKVWRLKNDPNKYVQAAVGWALGRMGDIRAIPYLIELSQDPESHLIRENAVEALGRIGGREAVVVEALLVATKDPSDFVRRHAVAALGKQGTVDVKGVLRDLYMTDPSSYVRREAYHVLRSARFRLDSKAAEPGEMRARNDNGQAAVKPVPTTSGGGREREEAGGGSLPESPMEDSSKPDIRDFSLLPNRDRTTQYAEYLIEEGRINEVLGQALFDSRQFKREVAQAALWSRLAMGETEVGVEDAAREIAEGLGEAGRQAVNRIHDIVEVCGTQFSLRILARTLQENRQRGSTVNAVSRDKTLAGPFFELIQRTLDHETRRSIFARPRDA